MALHPASFEAILRRCGVWDNNLIVCLDFADPRCIQQGAQLFRCLATGSTWFRGPGPNATAQDPTFVGVSGSFRNANNTTDFTNPAHFSFDGGDYLYGANKNSGKYLNRVFVNGSLFSMAAVYASPGLASAVTFFRPLIGAARGEWSYVFSSAEAIIARVVCGAGATNYQGLSTGVFSANTWTFGGSGLSYDAAAGGRGVHFLHAGTANSANTDTGAPEAEDVGDKLIIGADVDDAALTTPSTPLAATSRVMMLAAWTDRYVEAQQLLAIRNEIRAWRVPGIA